MRCDAMSLAGGILWMTSLAFSYVILLLRYLLCCFIIDRNVSVYINTFNSVKKGRILCE